MPRRWIRLLISLMLTLHLGVVALSLIAHRGSSYLHEDFLTVVAPYIAFGNWRNDFNRLPIGNASLLQEKIQIQWHQRNSPPDKWNDFPSFDASSANVRQKSLSRSQRLEQMWFQELSGLLLFENDEGVSRMLIAAIRSLREKNWFDFDRIRIVVALRETIEQYAELKMGDDSDAMLIAHQPEVAYEASIINLGDGQVSLLRQLSDHRSSKSLNNDKAIQGKEATP